MVRDIIFAALGSDWSWIKSNYDIGLAFGQIFYFMIISEYFYEVIQTFNLDIAFSLTGPADVHSPPEDPVG